MLRCHIVNLTFKNLWKHRKQTFVQTSDKTHHKSLNENTDDALKAHNEDRFGTLLVGGSRAIADGVLGFDGEEEAAGEGVDIVETGDEGFAGVGGRAEVAVREDDEPPDEGEEEPGQDEGEGEHEQRPAPLGVHEGSEDILKVPAPALRHVPLDYVTVSVLEDDTLAHAARCVSGLAISITIVREF